MDWLKLGTAVGVVGLLALALGALSTLARETLVDARAVTSLALVAALVVLVSLVAVRAARSRSTPYW